MLGLCVVEYRESMRQGCLYGSLSREVHEIDTWLQQETLDLDSLIQRFADSVGDFSDCITQLQVEHELNSNDYFAFIFSVFVFANVKTFKFS